MSKRLARCNTQGSFTFPLDMSRNPSIHLLFCHVRIYVHIGLLESWNSAGVHLSSMSEVNLPNLKMPYVLLTQPSMNNVQEQRPTSGPRRGEDPTTGMLGTVSKMKSCYVLGWEGPACFPNRPFLWSEWNGAGRVAINGNGILL